jgi:hypothetical protein
MTIQGIDRQRAGETAEALEILINYGKNYWSVEYRLGHLTELLSALYDAERNQCPPPTTPPMSSSQQAP